MKRFTCGDVVPDCSESFEAVTEDEILAAVGRHAAERHGMVAVPDEVVDAVRRSIVTF